MFKIDIHDEHDEDDEPCNNIDETILRKKYFKDLLLNIPTTFLIITL